jgi:GntR family transcriptional regulator
VPDNSRFRRFLIFYDINLKIYIKGEIDAGRFEPQRRIPSEAELCKRFDISRTVVRQAIKELQNEGYLITEKGKVTFVARPKVVGGLVQNLTGFCFNPYTTRSMSRSIA